MKQKAPDQETPDLKNPDLKVWLARSPIVAILRGVTPPEVEAIVEVLAESGILVVEVPLNSPDPFASIERVARRFGEKMLVGAGTVLGVDAVKRVADAGGRLIVTPHADVRVTAQAKASGLLAAPGFLTPTEAFALLDAGADALKLFPAEAASPAVLVALRAVLPPGTAVLPVGGIGPTTLAAWRRAGAHGFGVGSSIYKPGDSAADVRIKAQALMTALAAAAVWTV
jgi:2-dehydro-3-deoxyphosphogalactonate aldolase